MKEDIQSESGPEVSQKADSAPTAGPLPDRELDARLAEALGWKLRGLHPVAGSTIFGIVGHPIYATGSSDTMLPYFATDIRATFELVEEMRNRRWGLRIGTNGCAKEQNAAAFSQGFRGLGRDILAGGYCYSDGAWSVAGTIPRAIAEAALAALEAK